MLLTLFVPIIKYCSNEIPQPSHPPYLFSTPTLNDAEACTSIQWTQPDTAKVNKPIWVASFPGSGAEMFRLFVESITGGELGWSIYDNDHPAGNETCVEIRAATCKTHWPVLPKEAPTSAQNLLLYHSQAIVLLRNPVTAFPSRLNHQFEIVNRRGYHTQQAPEKVWNRWIRQHIQGEIQAYQSFVSMWQNATLPSVALFVPYEGLTDPLVGLLWAERVTRVLREANHRVPTESSALQCLWKRSIFDQPKRKRANHSYQAGYTTQEQRRLEGMMEDLLGMMTAAGRTSKNEKDVNQGLQDVLKSYAVSLSNTSETRILKI